MVVVYNAFFVMVKAFPLIYQWHCFSDPSWKQGIRLICLASGFTVRDNLASKYNSTYAESKGREGGKRHYYRSVGREF
jgi:hypothetical protein